MLPQRDLDALRAKSLEPAISSEGGMTCVVIRDYPIPEGPQFSNCGPFAALVARIS